MDINASKLLGLCGKFAAVLVKFKDSNGNYSNDKVYAYRCDRSLKVGEGDEVIVDSPYKGNVVVKVFGVDDDPDFFPSKWVVDKVDTRLIEALTERDEELDKLLKRAAAVKARDSVMKELEVMFGDSEAGIASFNKVLSVLK